MAVARSLDELETLGLEFTAVDLGTEEGCRHAITETEQRIGSDLP